MSVFAAISIQTAKGKEITRNIKKAGITPLVFTHIHFPSFIFASIPLKGTSHCRIPIRSVPFPNENQVTHGFLTFYYIDTSVLLENIPLVKFIQWFIFHNLTREFIDDVILVISLYYFIDVILSI